MVCCLFNFINSIQTFCFFFHFIFNKYFIILSFFSFSLIDSAVVRDMEKFSPITENNWEDTNNLTTYQLLINNTYKDWGKVYFNSGQSLDDGVFAVCVY